MSEHHGPSLTESDLRRFGEREKKYSVIALAVGIVALLVAVVWAFIVGEEGRGGSRFAFAYLTAFMYVLSFSVGCIGFLLLTYLFRGGWHVLFRRLPETIGANVAVVSLMALPIVGFVLADNGMLYNWAQPIDDIHYPTPFGDQSPEIYGGVGDQHESQDHSKPETKPESDHGHDQVQATAQDYLIIPAHAGHGGAPGHAHIHPAHDGHGGDPGHAHIHIAGNEASVAGDAHRHDPAHADAKASGKHHGPDKMMVGKRPWLNIPFFCVRIVFYLIVITGIGMFFWRNSLEQDETGNPNLTRRAEMFAAPATLVFALTVTFLVFDLIMSLDWTWYSTILGVYYFAGSMIAALSLMIILLVRLENLGYFRSLSREHYHDLGKLLFGFIFFWGYIAYSQYMLIWYASLPATTVWYAVRGATTVSEQVSPISYVTLVLLFGHVIIPFAGIMSRHIKRRRALLVFWAAWMLVMHYIDIWWLIMPQFESSWIAFGPIEIGCVLGLWGIFAFVAIQMLSRHSLVPLHDPRMPESLRFHNM